MPVTPAAIIAHHQHLPLDAEDRATGSCQSYLQCVGKFGNRIIADAVEGHGLRFEMPY